MDSWLQMCKVVKVRNVFIYVLIDDGNWFLYHLSVTSLFLWNGARQRIFDLISPRNDDSCIVCCIFLGGKRGKCKTLYYLIRSLSKTVNLENLYISTKTISYKSLPTLKILIIDPTKALKVFLPSGVESFAVSNKWHRSVIEMKKVN